jgi:MFS transporter, FHS family, L-fucose permease
MFVAQQYILAKISPATAAERSVMEAADLLALTGADLGIIRTPYVAIAGVLCLVFVAIAATQMPRGAVAAEQDSLRAILKRLVANPGYRGGVVAQAFYVGAQIMCWTFIIHYAEQKLGMDAATAQGYNIAAMIIFVCSRFICTFLLQYLSPGKLLMNLAILGAVLMVGLITMGGTVGLYCLVGASACMSLMFPTIYGIALKGIGDDSKIGSAGLIMAILGGSLMPPLQGALIDMGTIDVLGATMPAVRFSFVLPLICFLVVASYGRRTFKDRVAA